ncbi:MAG: low temperature requirement protein A [Leptolyngbyaceae cyanobacterium bins.302]|nr:low temperature requirement protein A [Leptolyngbyaceae cyanobacterium bins.302]
MTVKRLLWQRPTLRTDEEQERDRRVTWLELFFDLFIVVVVVELSHSFAEDISWAGVGSFVFLFLHLWWVWIASTYYTERFETEGVDQRFFTFLQMIPIGGMAVFAHYALGKTSVGFALSYALSRAIITYLWWRGGRYDRRFRPTARRYIVGFGLSILLYVLSIFVEPPTRFMLWGVGLLVDLMTPFFTLRLQALLPRFSTSKLPERFGLLVIIVLGESVMGVVKGVAQQKVLTPTIAIVGILGIALTFGVWWIYFDFINRRPPKPGVGWSFAWGYLHLPLTIAITATGAGMLNVVSDQDLLLDPNVSLLIGCSVGISLIVMGLLELTLQRTPDEPTHPKISPILKFAAGSIAILFGIISPNSWVVGLQVGLLLLLLIQMAYGLYVWFSQDLPLDSESFEVSTAADPEKPHS